MTKLRANAHPNATAAGAGGALGIVVVWSLTLAGLDVDATVGAAISTLCSSALVLAGRFGPFK